MPVDRVVARGGPDRAEFNLSPGVGLLPTPAEVLGRLAVLTPRTCVPDLDPGAGKGPASPVEDEEAQRQGQALQSGMNLGAPRGVQAVVGRDRRRGRGGYGGRTQRHGWGRRRGAGRMPWALEMRQERSQESHRHHHHEEFHQPSSHPSLFDAGFRKPAGGTAWRTRGTWIASGGSRAGGVGRIWRF